MTIPLGLFSWIPPSAAHFIYNVMLKPSPLRRAAQIGIKRMIPATLDFRGTRLVMNREDAVICGSLTLGCYENFFTQLLEALLEPGMTFLDVGANIGVYTALAARLVGPAGKVIAIEPFPDNVALMRETLALNGFENVTIAALAASDRAGEASLYLSGDNHGDHRLCDHSRTRRAVTVQTQTLDVLAQENGVARADVIKIDTQGSEAAVFAGMCNLMSAKPAPIILTEFWPWGLRQTGKDPRAFLEEIIAAGYAIYHIDGDQRALVLRNDISPLLRLKRESQYTELLLSQDGATVEALNAKLTRSR